MPLDIKEHNQDKLSVRNTANNLDKQLADMPDPLPNYSGFNMIIAGSSGSGKTTLLYSLMLRKKVKGIRQSYRGIFDHVYIVSPTMGSKSMKKDEFAKLPEDQIYRELNMETIMELDKKLQENRDNDEHSIVIFDDVGSQLRKSAQVEKKLVQLVQNRRHLFTSTIFIVQKFRDLPTGLRSNMSHFATFRPKNMPERDAIMSELFPFKRDDTDQIFDYVFEKDDAKDRYSFLLVDLSLKKSSKYRYFKNFNQLEF